jgi:hypothetical protein
MRSGRHDYFAWTAPTLVTQCLLCRWATPGKVPTCKAFPALIPDEILVNDYDHRQPWIDPDTDLPGDGGVPLQGSITFEPKADADPAMLAILYRHLDRLRAALADAE